MAPEKRGSIAFFSTYRSPVPLDIFSVPVPPQSKRDEVLMTDGESYNYNGQIIPPAALKAILKRPKLANSKGNDADVDSGRLSGMVFVSERGDLETLHVGLTFSDDAAPPKVEVFSFADIYGTFDGVRMEDSGRVAGDYLVYVTTKDPAAERRQPWSAIYKTNLKTGKTDRLTPKAYADISPSVSPSGKKVAVASFQRKGGWDGEIEDLQTDIFVINVEGRSERKLAVKNGGWPTWGSESVLFFHRKVGDFWGVFRADISGGVGVSSKETRVTPDGINAVTPAAIDSATVAVSTFPNITNFDLDRAEGQYRHIEIFDSDRQQQATTQVTRKITPKADHFNPFVIDGGKRIGYHRSKTEILKGGGDIPRNFNRLKSPYPDVGLFRVSGVFPTFSKDGSKLAFVDNEFRSVWLADSSGLRVVYELEVNHVFSPVWNQDPKKDILYVCRGPSFSAKDELQIVALVNVSSGKQHSFKITSGKFNNAFPSTNPDGTKLVFRSTRDGGDKKHKNLYVMEDAARGEFGGGKVTRLTTGDWTDTHCQWSPRGNWIVFSSTRDKPKTGVLDLDNGLDPGYFAVFLVNPDHPTVVVRVVGSGDGLAGHVNHPCFSPDGRSIVVTSDLAAVNLDPMSLPRIDHSVRPYGEIFTVDIDPDDIKKNQDVEKFTRTTHSRYENSTASWTTFSTDDPNAKWNLLLLDEPYTPQCPYILGDGGESWHMTGHLCIPKRCC